MNRAQKTALGSLVFVLLTLAMSAYMFFQLFILKKTPEGLAGRFLPLVVLILVGGTLFVWSFKRQSPREVKEDERDELIKKRAARISLISAWLLLAAATIIAARILGQDGSIPVYLLSLINVSVFLMALLIYSVAILVQYGCGPKGEKQ